MNKLIPIFDSTGEVIDGSFSKVTGDDRLEWLKLQRDMIAKEIEQEKSNQLLQLDNK